MVNNYRWADACAMCKFSVYDCGEKLYYCNLNNDMPTMNLSDYWVNFGYPPVKLDWVMAQISGWLENHRVFYFGVCDDFKRKESND